MEQRKVVLLILVVIAVLAALALGAGTYRSHREGDRTPRDYKDPDAGVKAIDGATGWMRTKFKLRRMSGCGTPASVITIQGACEVVIGPGSRRPSRFRLTREGGSIAACFALARTSLNACIADTGKVKQQALEDPSDFTVTGDSAFLWLKCTSVGGTPCRIAVAPS